MTSHIILRPLRILPLLLLLAAACLAVAGTVGTPDAGAKSAKRVVLGKNKLKPAPNCGRPGLARDCIVEGKVTAFQSLAQGAKAGGFVVPFKKGKVTSWSITLSRPLPRAITVNGTEHGAQVPFFNDLFGKPAKARIAVLKRVQKNKKPPRYKMVRQSPTQILNPYFGRTVHFALNKPLNVIRNQIIALTIPTWAPAFWTPWACSAAPNGGLNNLANCEKAKQQNTYRGSRGRGRCLLGFESNGDPNESLKKTRPHQKVDAVRPYACYYRGSRLLYTATVVSPD